MAFTRLKTTAFGTYTQLVEAYRDEDGKPRQRVIATLPRGLDRIEDAVDYWRFVVCHNRVPTAELLERLRTMSPTEISTYIKELPRATAERMLHARIERDKLRPYIVTNKAKLAKSK